MARKKARRTMDRAVLLLAGLTAVHLGLFLFGTLPRPFVETWFAGRITPFLRYVFSAPLSLLPVSLSQVLLLLLAAAGTWLLFRACTGRPPQDTIRKLVLLATLLCNLYLAGFGWLYHRPPLRERLGWKDPEKPVEAFERTALRLAEEAARLRCPPPPDSEGTFFPDLRPALVSALGSVGAKGIPPFRLKPALPRGFLLRLRTSGVFSPFTQEAHYDPGLSPFDLPFVAAHEAAHLAGFAPEQEADFLAWLATRRSTDRFVRYSGTLAALSKFERSASATLVETMRKRAGPGVLEDRRLAAEAFRRYEWKAMARISRRIYDRMLKAQGVEEGIGSYDGLPGMILAFEASRTAGREAGNGNGKEK